MCQFRVQFRLEKALQINFGFLAKQFPATISCDVTATSMWFLHAGQGKCYFVTVAFSGYFNPCPAILIFSQSDYLIWTDAINSHTLWQTVQVQINWLLQKPTDLDLHCLQRQVYPGSAGQGLIIIMFSIYR